MENALRQKRAECVRAMEEIRKKVCSEGRAFTEEEKQRFDALDTEQENIRQTYEAAERTSKLAAEMEGTAEKRPDFRGGDNGDAKAQAELESRAFEVWFRLGQNALEPAERAALERRKFTFDKASGDLAAITSDPLAQRILRAQTVTTTAGGYLIPTGFQAELEVSRLMYSSVEAVARVLRTATGNTINWPTMNDTSNKGRLLTINTAVVEGALTFDQIQIGAYKFSSDMVLVPSELLQDSAIPLATIIRDAFGERLGRIECDYHTTGTGNSQPQGVVIGAGLGATFAGVGAVTYNDLVDLLHSLDAAYRPRARWMFHDTTLKALKKLVDGQQRPLWTSGLVTREPDSILGYPYTINMSMAEIDTASPYTAAKCILFGDFNKFLVRRVNDIAVVRLNERYAEYDQVAFFALTRMDSKVLDAGTNPIVYGVQPTS